VLAGAGSEHGATMPKKVRVRTEAEIHADIRALPAERRDALLAKLGRRYFRVEDNKWAVIAHDEMREAAAAKVELKKFHRGSQSRREKAAITKRCEFIDKLRKELGITDWPKIKSACVEEGLCDADITIKTLRNKYSEWRPAGPKRSA
jgi:hypothetical protein